MFNRTATAEQRLQKAAVAIMAHPRYRALGGLVVVGSRTVTDDPAMTTACTNGRDERYDRAFVDRLNDAELRFLVLHELYHKMYQHLHTLQPLWAADPGTTNTAADMVINTQLVDENQSDRFATMTGPLKCGCYDEKYRGWDTVSVFRDLRKNGGGGGGGASGPGDQPQGFDQHDFDDAQALSSEEKSQLARDIDEALRQGALVAAKSGSGGARDMEELLQPQQDWREVLREFVQTTCTGHDYSTWRRPNRRYVGAGIYMPSGVSETIGEIVVAPDMSGSIGAPEVQRMLSELASIADVVKPEGVRLLYWDTAVCQDEHYPQDQLHTMIASTTPKGGGGTMVECVPAHMAKHNIRAQCAIVFTDGYLGGSWGEWTCPVLWVIVDNKNCRPPTGTTVHVKTSQF
jgi:predicted metal-dependent peptidase